MFRAAMMLGLLYVAWTPQAAHAGDQHGTIIRFWVNRAGYADIEMSGPKTGTPGCAVDVYWRLDTTTAGGTQVLAALLSAHSIGRTITIVGTNTCSVFPTRETVDYVVL